MISDFMGLIVTPSVSYMKYPKAVLLKCKEMVWLVGVLDSIFMETPGLPNPFFMGSIKERSGLSILMLGIL